MEPFTKLSGIVAPIDRANVDTDQIIPAVYLKRIERTGFGQFLFRAWRFLDDGSPNPDFILNRSCYREASILIAGPNFGSGSSREHAPWALLDYGFRVIIAPSLADIFRNNCFQNGMLPITLEQEIVTSIMSKATEGDGYRLAVDLQSNVISDDQGLSIPFEIDSFRRVCLLQGLDDIALSLQQEDKITAYEQRMGLK